VQYNQPVAKSQASRKRPSIRGEYEQHGVAGFYSERGGDYRNPHEPVIREALGIAAERWPLDLSRVLDLACGSGEVTLALRDLGAGVIDGVDPYTGEAYRERAGQAAEPFSFEEIAAGALAGRAYSLIVCSFALHLLEPSRLPGVCYRLAEIGDALLILTPHKRPAIRPAWGWSLEGEHVHARVRLRYYRSSLKRPADVLKC
jgi:SAM-dependent methyltransferase